MRSEIELWTSNSNTLLTAQLTTSGAIFGFVLSSPERMTLLLVIPIVSVTLFIRHFTNTREIARIARYIREQLSPRVPGGLNWERWYRDNPSRGLAFVWEVLNLVTFAGPALLAVSFSAPNAIQSLPLTIGWVLDCVITIFLTVLILSGNPISRPVGLGRLVRRLYPTD